MAEEHDVQTDETTVGNLRITAKVPSKLTPEFISWPTRRHFLCPIRFPVSFPRSHVEKR